MRRDPYEVIGVSRDADEKEIKRAFRSLARELHPDVNRHDPEAEEKFKEAAEAYEILSDADRRRIYDRFGFEGLDSRGFAPSAAGFGSFADIFDAFFGGDPFGGFGGRGFGRGGGPGPVHGGDIAVEVEVTLEQAARGAAVDVQYDAVQPCERCHGNGAEPGTPIEPCPRCQGTGEIDRSRARHSGSSCARTPATTVAARASWPRPRAPSARAPVAARSRRSLTVDVPAASSTSSASASPGAGTRASGAARRATSTCSCGSPPTSASCATATTS